MKLPVETSFHWLLVKKTPQMIKKNKPGFKEKL